LRQTPAIATVCGVTTVLDPVSGSAQDAPRPPRAKRVLLVALMAVLTVNIWTGGPLLALWLGSQVQQGGPPTMLAVAVAAVSLGVISWALVRLLARVDAAYGRISGRPTTVHRHVPWLRSMRGERPHADKKHASELAPLDIVLIVSVVVVILLFEIWFFFDSGSPIDPRSGRDSDAPLIGAVLAFTSARSPARRS
jgi:hypothetical protein